MAAQASNSNASRRSRSKSRRKELIIYLIGILCLCWLYQHNTKPSSNVWQQQDEELLIQWKQQKQEQLHNIGDTSFYCPELAKASRFVLENANSLPPELKMGMIQFVGQWNATLSSLDMFGIQQWRTQRRASIMNRVYEQNRRLFAPSSSRAIRAPSNATDKRKPHFWKMRAVLDFCTATQLDVVLYLDGDVLLTLPSARFLMEALWLHHSFSYSTVDILFAQDWNGPNSGIFMVNCTSTKALSFLKEWEDRAVEIKHKYFSHTVWNDQCFVQYAFKQKNISRRFDGIQTTESQCAFTRYPLQVVSSAPDSNCKSFQWGRDVSVHTPSMGLKQFRYFSKLLMKNFQQKTMDNRTEALALYLRTSQTNARQQKGR